MATTHCDYERLEDGRLRCRVCGVTTTRKWADPPKSVCRPPSTEPPVRPKRPVIGKSGLGDRVAAGLAAIGLTEERVASWLGSCGCKKRRERLNRLGRYVTARAAKLGIKLPAR